MVGFDQMRAWRLAFKLGGIWLIPTAGGAITWPTYLALWSWVPGWKEGWPSDGVEWAE